MAKVLIIYYSRTGNTRAMADLVAEGIRTAGAEPIVKPVQETRVDELLEFQGLVFGSPTYYGGMAAEIKHFIDASVKLHGKLVDKVGGAFTSSGGIAGGNETAIMDILKALLIHGMVIPGNVNGDHYGPVAVGAPDKRSAGQCQRIGEIIGRLTLRLHPG
ncbi:MAG: flavodoxin family protein [Kiritimatiellia bacterium]|nr:NAD(P)H-dependent oxidoreductase [Lentisphaerota bacterium]